MENDKQRNGFKYREENESAKADQKQEIEELTNEEIVIENTNIEQQEAIEEPIQETPDESGENS